MRRSTLHEYDLLLCNYVRDSIRAHLPKGMRYAALAALEPSRSRHRTGSRADPSPWYVDLRPRQAFAHLVAHAVRSDGLKAYLFDEKDDLKLLLNDEELDELATAFEGVDFRLLRRWKPDKWVHDKYIECQKEIMDFAAPEAKAFARIGHRSALLLMRKPHLDEGIRIVADWIRPLRRILKAMHRNDLLPRPGHDYGTPTTATLELADVPPDLQSYVEMIMAAFKKDSGLRTSPGRAIIKKVQGRRQKMHEALRWLKAKGVWTPTARRSQRQD